MSKESWGAMGNAKISVIIPCYNAEHYLRRCVESVLGQSIGINMLEIILVNDASTDGTWELIRGYEEQYPANVIGINLRENIRQGGARNRALEVAAGECITFVDADDWIEQDMYEKMYEKLMAYRCDLVFCRSVRDDGLTTRFSRETGEESRLIVIDSDEKREEFIAANLIGVGVWDKLYRRELIFNPRLRFLERMAYEDICWGALVYLYTRRIYILEERLYHYYVNPESTVLKKNMPYHYDIFKVNLIKWEEYIRRGALKKYPEAVKYDFLLTYYIAGMKMLALRFDETPYEMVYELQKTTKELVPDYRENKYVKRDAKEIYRLLFDLLDKELSREDIDNLCNVIRSIHL